MIQSAGKCGFGAVENRFSYCAVWEPLLNTLKEQSNLELVLSYYEYGTATTQTLGRCVQMKLKATDINKKTFTMHSVKHVTSLG